MYRLLKWHFIKFGEKDVVVNGIIINNPNLRNGKNVNIGKIRRIFIDDENRQVIIKNYSGDSYIAKYKDICTECIEDIEEGLRIFDISKEQLKVFENVYKEAKVKLNEYVTDILNPNELYVEIAGVRALKALFMTNRGEIKEIPIRFNSGIGYRACLISVVSYYTLDFSYFFTEDKIEVYSWRKGLNAVKLYNLADDITYIHGEEEIKIKRNELTEIYNKDQY